LLPLGLVPLRIVGAPKNVLPWEENEITERDIPGSVVGTLAEKSQKKQERLVIYGLFLNRVFILKKKKEDCILKWLNIVVAFRKTLSPRKNSYLLRVVV